MIRTCLTAILVSTGCPVIAADVKPFDVYPALKVFPVLGKASGTSTEENNTRCLTVNAIELFVNEGGDGPIKVTGIRFGLGVPEGKDDWGMAGRGELYPFGVKVSPNSAARIPGTLISCFVDSSAKNGIKWIFMEVRTEDASGVGYSYMHSKEFEQFLKSVNKSPNAAAGGAR